MRSSQGKSRSRHRSAVSALTAVALTLAFVASFGVASCGGDDVKQGEVVSVGAAMSLGALTSGVADESSMAVSSLEVDVGDETVTAEVQAEDQSQLSDLFANGDLEGAQVEVKSSGDDGWVFVDVVDGG
jgi:hypothetical protein